ncbi:MAG: ParB/RepB/Spo0J family partition protein [Candidatus Bathyarchaeia archaeon]
MKPKFQEIEVSKIDISETNVRKSKTTDAELASLVASIKEKGVLQPVVLVRKGDRFELPVGQNRLNAAKAAELERIPAMVYEEMNEADMRVISAIENLQRIDLGPADRAAAVSDLLRELGSKQAVAKALGYSEGWVSYQLGIKGLPDDVKTMINEKKISTTEGSALKYMMKWSPPAEVTRVAKIVSEYSKKNEISREKRKTAIQIARTRPTISADELKERVEKKVPLLTMNISISEAEMAALRRAANMEDETPEDLVHRILNEWLVQNEYAPEGQ